MRGSTFMHTLHAAFPGLLKAAYKDRPLNDEGDTAVCALLLPLAQLVDAHLTPEVCAKARQAAGIVAYRQVRRRNGVRPDVAPAPEAELVEQQLPLAASEPVGPPAPVVVDVPETLANEVVATLLETFAAKLRANP